MKGTAGIPNRLAADDWLRNQLGLCPAVPVAACTARLARLLGRGPSPAVRKRASTSGESRERDAWAGSGWRVANEAYLSAYSPLERGTREARQPEARVPVQTRLVEFAH